MRCFNYRLRPSISLDITINYSDIKEVFDRMDQDKNGVITVVEIDDDMKEFLESQNNTKTEGKKKGFASCFNE